MRSDKFIFSLTLLILGLFLALASIIDKTAVLAIPVQIKIRPNLAATVLAETAAVHDIPLTASAVIIGTFYA